MVTIDLKYREAIKERLGDIKFPCSLFVSGPENCSRTKFRREHGGCFGYRFVNGMQEAVEFIDGLNYEGFIREMSIYRTEGEIEEI